MARRIVISFEKHDARAVAELVDDAAPLTAEAFWNALPLSGAAYHAKWANNEVYILTPPFAERDPGKENATVFPIPGDILYLPVPPWQQSSARHAGAMSRDRTDRSRYLLRAGQLSAGAGRAYARQSVRHGPPRGLRNSPRPARIFGATALAMNA